MTGNFWIDLLLLFIAYAMGAFVEFRNNGHWEDRYKELRAALRGGYEITESGEIIPLTPDEIRRLLRLKEVE